MDLLQEQRKNAYSSLGPAVEGCQFSKQQRGTASQNNAQRLMFIREAAAAELARLAPECFCGLYCAAGIVQIIRLGHPLTEVIVRLPSLARSSISNSAEAALLVVMFFFVADAFKCRGTYPRRVLYVQTASMYRYKRQYQGGRSIRPSRKLDVRGIRYKGTLGHRPKGRR